MTDAHTDETAREWPEPPSRVYPHRYGYCSGCSRVVRDFQSDEVWRDRGGSTVCGAGGLASHRVVQPSGTTGGA